MKIKNSINLPLIGCLCVLGVLVVLFYNFYSNNAGQKYLKSGGFLRKPLTVNLTPKGYFDLKDDYYNIVGISENKILINRYNDRNLIVFNSFQTRSFLKLPDIINPESIFDMSINESNDEFIDIQCNNDKMIYVFDAKSQKINRAYKFDTYFDNANLTSNGNLYAFIEGDEANQLVLASIKFDDAGNENVIKRSQILKTSMTDDGIFKSSGSDLIYVNYYNNNISVIDSALATETRFHTIDTVTTRPKTITIRNNSLTKFTVAPRSVNQLLQIANGFLFINSYVRSDNDSENDPKQNCDLIDVYDIKKSCKYIGTMYLARNAGQPIQDFLVQNNILVLQYPDKTTIYDFSL